MDVWTKTEVAGSLTSSQGTGRSVQYAGQVGVPGPGVDCQEPPCAGGGRTGQWDAVRGGSSPAQSEALPPELWHCAGHGEPPGIGGDWGCRGAAPAGGSLTAGGRKGAGQAPCAQDTSP